MILTLHRQKGVVSSWKMLESIWTAYWSNAKLSISIRRPLFSLWNPCRWFFCCFLFQERFYEALLERINFANTGPQKVPWTISRNLSALSSSEKASLQLWLKFWLIATPRGYARFYLQHEWGINLQGSDLNVIIDSFGRVFPLSVALLSVSSF